MTMPTRHEIHPVLLNVLSDWEGTPRAKDVVAEVTRRFPQLTTADLSKVNKDGGSTWRNRVHWARQDLVMRGLVDKSVHGVWLLTEKGVSTAKGVYPQIEPMVLDIADEAAAPFLQVTQNPNRSPSSSPSARRWLKNSLLQQSTPRTRID